MIAKGKAARTNGAAAKSRAQKRLLGQAAKVRDSDTKKQVRSIACPTCGAPNPPKQRFFDEKWLATRWGVSVKKLQADRAKGVGVKYTKLGDAVHYRLRDVVAYEKANTRINTVDLED